MFFTFWVFCICDMFQTLMLSENNRKQSINLITSLIFQWKETIQYGRHFTVNFTGSLIFPFHLYRDMHSSAAQTASCMKWCVEAQICYSAQLKSWSPIVWILEENYYNQSPFVELTSIDLYSEVLNLDFLPKFLFIISNKTKIKW